MRNKSHIFVDFSFLLLFLQAPWRMVGKKDDRRRSRLLSPRLFFSFFKRLLKGIYHSNTGRLADPLFSLFRFFTNDPILKLRVVRFPLPGVDGRRQVKRQK